MPQTHTGVVPLHDVPEVIDERLDGRVILVVDVLRTTSSRAEGTLLHAGIGSPLGGLLLLLGHKDRNEAAGLRARGG